MDSTRTLINALILSHIRVASARKKVYLYNYWCTYIVHLYMKFYEIVNMYNFHFDRKFYFENKTTFIEFLLPDFSRKKKNLWRILNLQAGKKSGLMLCLVCTAS